MMNSRELRIGNLVNYHDDYLLFEVTRIDDLGIGVKNSEPETAQETWIEYECFSPIPLTEEWLVKFGFERSGLYVFKNSVYIYDEYGIKNTGYEFRFELSSLTLKYVHQLQNLYFALTNEELTYENN